MSTLPLPTLAAQLSATGVSAPAFADILNSDIAIYQGIFGSDTLLQPDDQDLQLIAARCAAINDCNQLAIAVYNAILIAFAQGVGLSALVQLIGIQRETATNSTATVVLSGVAGTIIQGGIARDTNGNLWNIPTPTTIPVSGAVTVTATAQQAGAITAIIGAINTPYTIISGWQSVTNPSAATPGAPVEIDAALRQRAMQSTALASITPLDAILSAVANSGGIGRYRGYENDLNVPDTNGIPRNSIAIVVEGGNANVIASTIQQKKAPGTGTYGTTSVQVVDSEGLPVQIKFFELAEVPIYVSLTIQPLTGYVSTTGQAAVAAVVAFIDSLAIGQTLYYNWLLGVAGLNGNPLGLTFAVTVLLIGTSLGPLSPTSVTIAFNAAAQCSTVTLIGG